MEVYNLTKGTTVQAETKLETDVTVSNVSSKDTYKVVVSFIGNYDSETSTRYTAATATKYINVYDNLTTTVSGSITESVTETVINAKVGADFSAEATIAASLFSTTDTSGEKR